MPSLIVIHSHLLDGITASACSLPPFLPASDPRLPDAHQGKVLSLHHLKGKFFTYMNTQLSKYNDLAAHPPIYIGFERTGRTPKLQVTRLRLRVSGAILDSLAWSKASSGTNPPRQLNKPLEKAPLKKGAIHLG
jgi:hypothetical protein